MVFWLCQAGCMYVMKPLIPMRAMAAIQQVTNACFSLEVLSVQMAVVACCIVATAPDDVHCVGYVDYTQMWL